MAQVPSDHEDWETSSQVRSQYRESRYGRRWNLRVFVGPVRVAKFAWRDEEASADAGEARSGQHVACDETPGHESAFVL